MNGAVERGVRPVGWLVLTLVGVAGCAFGSYNYVQDWWDTLPTVFARRGSAVVTLATFKTRITLHHQETSFWSNGGESMRNMETVGSSCYDLDVRTCKVAARWRCPAKGKGVVAPGEEGEEGERGEREMIGSVRFSTDDGKTNLRAVNAATGQSWTAATGFGQILSVTAVPAARRVAVVTMAGAVLVYDVDANRVVACR